MAVILRALGERYDAWQRARVRRAYTSVGGLRSARDGLAGMVEEMAWGLAHLDAAARDEADRRVLETIFFGPAAVRMLGGAFRRWPAAMARTMARSSPLALRFLVGEARHDAPDQVVLSECTFRRAGGEEVCRRVCQGPTEAFCARAGLPVVLEPDARGPGCRWTWGTTR